VSPPYDVGPPDDVADGKMAQLLFFIRGIGNPSGFRWKCHMEKDTCRLPLNFTVGCLHWNESDRASSDVTGRKGVANHCDYLRPPSGTSFPSKV